MSEDEMRQWDSLRRPEENSIQGSIMISKGKSCMNRHLSFKEKTSLGVLSGN